MRIAMSFLLSASLDWPTAGHVAGLAQSSMGLRMASSPPECSSVPSSGLPSMPNSSP